MGVALFNFDSYQLKEHRDDFSSYETSLGGAKTGNPEKKTPDKPESRTWLVSHVPLVGLEPSPDTAVRSSNG